MLLKAETSDFTNELSQKPSENFHTESEYFHNVQRIAVFGSYNALNVAIERGQLLNLQQLIALLFVAELILII